MSLVRTAVRLCVVEALKGQTIAEGRIYDSRIGEIQPETFLEDAKPTVIVLTDGDDGDALSEQNGGPPFNRMVDLVFEIGMCQSQKSDSDPSGFIIGFPDTDARLEAALDVLEFQILRRLAYDLTSISAVFRSFVRPMKYDSHRQVLDDSGVKIAARIVTLTCQVMDDQVAILMPNATPPTGINLLPDPLFRVAQVLPNGSAGYDTVQGIIAALTSLTSTALTGVDTKVTTTDATPTTPDIEQTIDLPQ